MVPVNCRRGAATVCWWPAANSHAAQDAELSSAGTGGSVPVLLQNLLCQHLSPQLTPQICLLQGDLQVEVAVQNDGSGHPQIASMGRASMHFEDVDVQTFDAKLAWLYNIVLR